MDELDLERYWAVVRPNRRKPPEPEKELDSNYQVWVAWVTDTHLSGERIPITLTAEGMVPIMFPMMLGALTIVGLRFYVNPEDWQLIATVTLDPVTLARGDTLKVELNVGPDSLVRKQVVEFSRCKPL